MLKLVKKNSSSKAQKTSLQDDGRIAIFRKADPFLTATEIRDQMDVAKMCQFRSQEES